MRLQLERAAAKITASNPVCKEQGDPWASPSHRWNVRAPFPKADAPKQQRKEPGRCDESRVLRAKRGGLLADKATPPGPQTAVRTPNARLWPSALSPALTWGSGPHSLQAGNRFRVLPGPKAREKGEPESPLRVSWKCSRPVLRETLPLNAVVPGASFRTGAIYQHCLSAS